MTAMTATSKNSPIHTDFRFRFRFLTTACSTAKSPEMIRVMNKANPPPNEFPPPLLMNNPFIAVSAERIKAIISKIDIGVTIIFLMGQQL